MNLKQIKEERFEEDSLEPKMVDQREVFQNKIRLMQYKCVKTKGQLHGSQEENFRLLLN